MAILDMPRHTKVLIEQALRPLKAEGLHISRINLLRDVFEKAYNHGLMAGWALASKEQEAE